MTDIEKAKLRETLLAALGAGKCGHFSRSFDLIGEVLRELDGDGEEEWWEVGQGTSQWSNTFYVTNPKSGDIVAANLREPIARRIADDHNLLPRLERAAWEAEAYICGKRLTGSINVLAALRSALGEDKP